MPKINLKPKPPQQPESSEDDFVISRRKNIIKWVILGLLILLVGGILSTLLIRQPFRAARIYDPPNPACNNQTRTFCRRSNAGQKWARRLTPAGVRPAIYRCEDCNPE